MELISKAVAKVNSLLQGFQIKQVLSVVLVAFLLLTTNVDSGRNNKTLTKRLDQVVHQDDSQRPKTTGEWNREAREVKGQPGERVNRIGKQSAEAVKDWGSLYTEGAKRAGAELRDKID